MTQITLPHNWGCRPYQNNLWRYFAGGGKRAVAVWHRRAGKDQTSLHWTTVATQQRVGVYWHMLPTLRQGRKVVWEGIDGNGDRFLDAWPGWRSPGEGGLVSHIRHDEMKIELHNGSIWYVTGSDNYDSLMGTNPVGVVFSEWSLSNPRAWDYIRPILAENGGWALFIYTPRGRNHGATMFENARNNQDWFCERLSVDDTGSITPEAIQAERDAGMAEELIQQEFWCSFEAPLVGSFWGDQLIACEKDKRITHVPHDTSIKVDTWWDLGHSDATAIWFVQNVGSEIHLIDYYENNGEPLEHYAAVLQGYQQEKNYIYGSHIWPHDGGAKSLASGGRPLNAMFYDLGFQANVQPRHKPEVAIQRVRQILPRCWFDEKNTQLGLDALRAFRKQLDEERSTENRPYYKPGYVHDWSSHGSSAFYTGAMTYYGGGQSSRIPEKRDYRNRRASRPRSFWAA